MSGWGRLSCAWLPLRVAAPFELAIRIGGQPALDEFRYYAR